jgi:steroid 5-alpha reductase family enzyme
MTDTVLQLLAIGSATVCGLMMVLWLVHLPLRNAAIVDAGWAGGLALLAFIYAALGGGYPLRAQLIATMAGVWGLRLALFLLLTRVVGQAEEGRYAQLRRQWGGNLPLKFLLFFQAQALLCILLSAPFLLAALNKTPQLSVLEWSGLGLWVVAFLGELAADFQLARFKSNSANRGATCRVGLWRYSRHPNYFFEWLIWIAFALFALPAPHGYLALLSPALILFFLFHVTGIPATEAQALRSRGEEYRKYQQSTSSFVPWFPRT